MIYRVWLALRNNIKNEWELMMEIMIKEENNNNYNMQHNSSSSYSSHFKVHSRSWDLWFVESSASSKSGALEGKKIFMNFSQALHRLHNMSAIFITGVCESLMKQRGVCFFLNEGLQLRNYFINFDKCKFYWVANPLWKIHIYHKYI